MADGVYAAAYELVREWEKQKKLRQQEAIIQEQIANQSSILASAASELRRQIPYIEDIHVFAHNQGGHESYLIEIGADRYTVTPLRTSAQMDLDEPKEKDDAQ